MDTKSMNTTALAYMGDAVYEIYIRQHVLEKEQVHVDQIHKAAIRYVKAAAQARVIKALMAAEGMLSPEELSLVKRARNRKSASKPKNADPVEYKLATAFEALLGYLYLTENAERLAEIVAYAIAIIENENK